MPILRSSLALLPTDADFRVCAFPPLLCWLWAPLTSTPILVYLATPILISCPRSIREELLKDFSRAALGIPAPSYAPIAFLAHSLFSAEHVRDDALRQERNERVDLICHRGTRRRLFGEFI